MALFFHQYSHAAMLRITYRTLFYSICVFIYLFVLYCLQAIDCNDVSVFAIVAVDKEAICHPFHSLVLKGTTFLLEN